MIKELDAFAEHFNEDFRHTAEVKLKPRAELPKNREEAKEGRENRLLKEIKEQKEVKPKAHGEEWRPSSLAEKLQMLFLLKNNEGNESYIRSIGLHYGMGQETENEYVITIDDKNKYWHQFIDKNGY